MKRLSVTEIQEKMKDIPLWQKEGICINRLIEFKNFLDGIKFINEVAKIAEETDHHPDIDIRYRRVLFSLSTHSEGGLTEKDFDMAKKIDGLYNSVI